MRALRSVLGPPVLTALAAALLTLITVRVARCQDSDVQIGAGKDGFYLQSRGGAFVLRFRGGFQADSRFFLADRTKLNTDSFLGRRVRPIVEGTVQERYDFRLMFDLVDGRSTLYDAYMDVRPSDAFKIRFGKFKTLIGLERIQSFGDVRFLERGYPTSIAPNRDYGVMIHGDVAQGALSYAAAVVNGVPDGGNGDSDTSDDKDAAARLFLQPFKNRPGSPLAGLGLGMAGSLGNQDGALPSYKSAGQATVFAYGSTVIAAGERVRLHPQAYFYVGPLGILTEFARSKQAASKDGLTTDITNEAWQVETTWLLTGEKASFKTITPDSPFNFYGGTGAIELVARYQRLDLDAAAFRRGLSDPAKSVSRASTVTGGVNWYLNRNVRFAVNYELTDFHRGATAGRNRNTERVLMTRYQFVY